MDVRVNALRLLTYDILVTLYATNAASAWRVRHCRVINSAVHCANETYTANKPTRPPCRPRLAGEPQGDGVHGGDTGCHCSRYQLRHWTGHLWSVGNGSERWEEVRTTTTGRQ